MFSTDSEMPIYEERKISKVHLIVSLILHIHHNILGSQIKCSLLTQKQRNCCTLRYSLKGIQNDIHSHLL